MKKKIQAEMQVEVDRKRSRVKTELYPFLLEKSKSVEDAKVFCKVIALAIHQSFNNRMKDIKLSELKLDEMVKSNPDFEKYKEVLNMFGGENLPACIEIFEGMSDVIDSFIREENTKRPLSELKATFL